MLFGSLVELHALLHSYLCFSFLEKLILSYLNTSSIPPQHLAICRDPKLLLIVISTDPRQLGGSIEKVPRPSIASRQLVDRSSFYSCVFALFLDTSSTASSVDVVFLDTFLDRWLNTSICRELLSIYIKDKRDPDFIFSQSLSQYLCLLTSQITLSLTPHHFSSDFRAFSSFLFTCYVPNLSFFMYFHVLKPKFYGF